MPLKREDAIVLSAEVGDIAIRMQCVVAKYNLEEHGDGGFANLVAALLRALLPYVNDPLISANLLKAGVSISPEEVKQLAVHTGWPHTIRSKKYADRSLHDNLFAKQVSEQSQLSQVESVGDLSTTCGLSTTWSRGLSEQSLMSLEGSEANQNSSVSMHQPTRVPCPFRNIQLVPQYLKGSDCTKWTISMQHVHGLTVQDLRRKLGGHFRVPLGKIRLEYRSSTDSLSNTHLKDTEDARNANYLCIRNVVATPPSAGQGSEMTAYTLSREQARSLQQEILDGMTSLSTSTTVDRETLLEVQSRVLPRYGFAASPRGVSEMLKAFDRFVDDRQIEQVGDEINIKLGLQPQVFRIADLADKEELSNE